MVEDIEPDGVVKARPSPSNQTLHSIASGTGECVGGTSDLYEVGGATAEEGREGLKVRRHDDRIG